MSVAASPCRAAEYVQRYALATDSAHLGLPAAQRGGSEDDGAGGAADMDEDEDGAFLSSSDEEGDP